jgi:hypothetical protein
MMFGTFDIVISVAFNMIAILAILLHEPVDGCLKALEGIFLSLNAFKGSISIYYILGVKFAAELLAMGLRMTMHLHPGFILINIDLQNAYNFVWRAALMDIMMDTDKLRWVIPTWPVKLGPISLACWADESNLWCDDGLIQGGIPGVGSWLRFDHQQKS